MKVLIIGGDAAGMSAAMQIRRRQPDWAVTVLEKGHFTSYASCGIPYYLAGDVERFDDLVVITPEQFREKRGIDVRTGWEALSIDTSAGSVRASTDGGDEHVLPYDRLLIATGASPIVPPWEGVELEGVVPLRNLDDTRRLERLLEAGASHCVVVGAGYIGLEMAEALQRRGLSVTVLEKLPDVMGGAPEKVTQLTAEQLDREGVALHLETAVTGFSGTHGKLQSVESEKGSFPADLAVLALGVRPNSQIAKETGIELGASGAISVDVGQRTRVDRVFAAGDCCEAHHLVLSRPAYIPLALTANRQGRVAGTNIAGGDAQFPGIVGSAVSRAFDLTLARTGIDAATAEREGIPFETVEVSAPSRAHYFPGSHPLWVQLIYRSDNRKLLGAWLAGRDESAGKRADVLAAAITAGMSVDQVADLDLSYAPPFAPVWDPILQAANRARFRREKNS